jgi:hypothetical protein
MGERAGSALGQKSIREEWLNLDLGTLITDLLAEVRVGSPKPSRTHSCAVKDTCQGGNFQRTGNDQLTRRFDIIVGETSLHHSLPPHTGLEELLWPDHSMTT